MSATHVPNSLDGLGGQLATLVVDGVMQQRRACGVLVGATLEHHGGGHREQVAHVWDARSLARLAGV